MVKVVKHNSETIDKLLRRFKRSCNNAGVVTTYKENRFFEKDSEKNSLVKRRLQRVYSKSAEQKNGLTAKMQFRNLSSILSRKETKSPSLRRPG